MSSVLGVYVLTDMNSKKFYIGSSQDVEKRKNRHFSELERGIHHCQPFQELWDNKKYAIHTKIYPTDTREEAYVLEQDFLDRFRDSPLLLNIGLHAKGGDNLTKNKNREEIILKIKNAIKKKLSILTAEDKRMLFSQPGNKNGMWGKTHTPEVRKKLSEIHKGNKYGLGVQRTEKERKRLSDLAKLRIGKLNPFFGKKHSEETKQKWSEKRKAMKIKSPLAKRVVANGIEYRSLTDAGLALGVVKDMITYRIKSDLDKYSNYYYVT